MARRAAPTCRPPRRATSNGWAWASRTCSTTSWPCSTTPAYREANAGALRMEWPRIPLPGWPGGTESGAADRLAESAARGRKLAALLDPDTPVPGVTEGTLRPDIAAVAVPSTTDGTNMTGDDFALTAGWGHFGQGDAVMPGQGRTTQRPTTPSEQAALSSVTQDTFGLSLSKACPEPAEGASAHQHNAANTLGNTTFDIYLNDRAYWRNVPANVWQLQAGRLPGPQEVALLPRPQSLGPGTATGGGATLHGHRPADSSYTGLGAGELTMLNWIHRRTRRDGFWWTVGAIAVLAIGIFLFWFYLD